MQHLDFFLDQFLEKCIHSNLEVKEKTISNSKLFFLVKEDLQKAMQIGSLAVADSSRVKVVVELDDLLEPLNLLERIEFVEHLVQEPHLFLQENSIAKEPLTVLSFKTYWESELFLIKASQHPHKQIAKDYLFHRARSWAASMLFMLKPALHKHCDEKIIESTALRGLCLAIMDDAEDAQEDIEKKEHSIFTVYPEHAKHMSKNALHYVQDFNESGNGNTMFSEIETLMKYKILDVLAAASYKSLSEFQVPEKTPSIFHVRKFLSYLYV